MEHNNFKFSKNNFSWDVQNCESWKGGHFKVSNLSQGYHAILKQWWDKYNEGQNAKVLLISESPQVKQEFKNYYPKWQIDNLDFFPELTMNDKNSDYTYILDLCLDNPAINHNQYDIIINQANLEHMYNPFQAMKNLIKLLKPNGQLYTHTHPPGFGYHQFPRDYIRFMIDWWIDLPNFMDPKIELIELYMTDNEHVFSMYSKL